MQRGPRLMLVWCITYSPCLIFLDDPYKGIGVYLSRGRAQVRAWVEVLRGLTLVHIH